MPRPARVKMTKPSSHATVTKTLRILQRSSSGNLTGVQASQESRARPERKTVLAPIPNCIRAGLKMQAQGCCPVTKVSTTKGWQICTQTSAMALWRR